MSKKRSQDGNGAPLTPAVPPLSQEEFAEMVVQFQKRGLPTILYVFGGPDSTTTNRIVDANYRQMAAAAAELDEWSRGIFRGQLANMQSKTPALARTGIVLPKNLRGQGQG